LAALEERSLIFAIRAPFRNPTFSSREGLLISGRQRLSQFRIL
jgi:hypothetical protein